jgi:hypothetical protein
MSPKLHIPLVRSRQDETVASTHDADDPRAAAGGAPRTARYRVGQGVVTLGVGLAVAIATVNGIHPSPHAAKAGGHLSASVLASDIRTQEAEGYTAWRCTPQGTLLRDSKGQFHTISW